ncbi:amidohydrolase family protein [Curtobacterium sp. MCPF17_002]|uniref:amidohydrolase family protein n=1 Tax=Curtobacterium sp. MCPF17_002 TaxID=2175645 RepID=UPI001C64FF38|nr:amidohydrolase family protein [Curtobacterium sp. MCPF17_002]WIB77095.1 amidohydrolase family protein [Curtobacterium sp. MCPF17_002]
MIIDAHHHLWDPADRPYPWMDDSVAPIRRRFDVDDLRTVTRDTDVTRTIVVQAVHDPGETAWLFEQPEPVAGVVGWVDLTAPDVTERLGAIGHPRLVGIRHQAQDEPDPDWLARPDVTRGIRAVAAAGLVFDLLVREREHAAALALVDAVPEASFVLDHAGKPAIAASAASAAGATSAACPTTPAIATTATDGAADAWRARMREFAARPNVVCKVSGLLTEAGDHWRDRPVARYAREVVETFGPDRTVFGSDWPVSTLATDYAEVLAVTTSALADLSEHERDAVFRGTAERVYLARSQRQT